MIRNPAERFAKRLLDVLASAVAGIVLTPLLAGVALAVWVTMGRPILFKQSRVGYRERLFTMYKFRTMRNALGPSGLLPDEDRLTGLGKLLRETSLDELPELFNVMRGDMSLVGPRPLISAYLPRYTKRQRRRHETKPGITGWAQINGRNSKSWEEKFELDVWYVEHQNLWLDLRILCLTVWTVLRREGISKQGHATMPEFQGTSGGDTAKLGERFSL